MVAGDERGVVVRLVAVSPCDVSAERELLDEIVDELNRGVAPALGCRLSLWRWETDVHPGLHLEGPQGLIDAAMRIEQADVVVGIFWSRLGGAIDDGGSATEHELRRAWDAWSEHQRPDVLIYFCQRAVMPSKSEEALQLYSLLRFREAMPKEQFWCRYESPREFEGLVRTHLTKALFGLRTQTRSQPIAAERPIRSLFNLPLRAVQFAGRKRELDAIDASRATNDLVVVTGIAGVGKSQLVARYAQTHAGEYDIVGWIRARDGGSVDLADLAVELGLPVLQTTPEERAARALRWLSHCDERWLLVLDDVPAARDLNRCCPRAGNGLVIVTTRDRDVAQFGPGLSVGVFDRETAVEYLLHAAGNAGDRDGAARLADALGHLPLALSHAAAYCATGTSFDEYLAMLEELPAAELFTTHPDDFYTRTAASTWEISIQAATEEFPLAGRLLALAAHLGPDPIPGMLFEVLLDDGADPAQRKLLQDAFNALQRLCLASVGESIDFHPLLQKTIRDGAPDDEGAHDALVALERYFPHNSSRAETSSACEQLLPHVLALSRTFPSPSAPRARLFGLLATALDYLQSGAAHVRAIDVARLGRALARHDLGVENPATLAVRRVLAECYLAVGKTGDAIETYRLVLQTLEATVGPSHPDTLSTRGDIAECYRVIGRVAEAIAMQEHVLEESERILGKEDRAALTARGRLAACYWAAGRTSEAIDIEERLVADCERIAGPDDPVTLGARSDVAVSYWTEGRIADAITIQEPLLAACKRILGEDHRDTLRARGDLAASYWADGRLAEAIGLEERVLVDRERILGPQDPDTLTASGNLAASYRKAGRVEEAIALEEQVFADRELILGPEHPATLAASVNLAESYWAVRRVADSIAIQEIALNNRVRVLGDHHPDTQMVRRTLVSALRHVGRDADADVIAAAGLAREPGR